MTEGDFRRISLSLPGATLLCLAACDEPTANGALTAAWRGVASKTQVKAFDAVHGVA